MQARTSPCLGQVAATSHRMGIRTRVCVGRSDGLLGSAKYVDDSSTLTDAPVSIMTSTCSPSMNTCRVGIVESSTCLENT